MTANLLLIRHAAHGHLGQILTGRLPDIPLSTAGAGQALALCRALAGTGIDAIHSSPSLRAQETGRHLADQHGLAVEVVDALDEVDFGEWTGLAFADLASDPRWQEWNARRSTARTPGGESMEDAQSRVVAHMRDTAERHAGGTVAMVTHCDIIRAAIAAVLGLSLDQILQFDIAPASVSRIVIGEWGCRVVSINEEVACRA